MNPVRGVSIKNGRFFTSSVRGQTTTEKIVQNFVRPSNNTKKVYAGVRGLEEGVVYLSALCVRVRVRECGDVCACAFVMHILQEYVSISPSHVMTHDNTSAVMKKFLQFFQETGKPINFHNNKQPVFTLVCIVK